MVGVLDLDWCNTRQQGWVAGFLVFAVVVLVICVLGWVAWICLLGCVVGECGLVGFLVGWFVLCGCLGGLQLPGMVLRGLHNIVNLDFGLGCGSPGLTGCGGLVGYGFWLGFVVRAVWVVISGCGIVWLRFMLVYG